MLQSNTENANGDNSWNVEVDSYGVADIGYHETHEDGTSLKGRNELENFFFVLYCFTNRSHQYHTYSNAYLVVFDIKC